MKNSEKKYQVIRDTREQQGWDFGFFDSCKGMVEQKLDTGDYTIIGFENKVCIERKASVSELAGNVTTKRFERELERMSLFKHKIIVCEFSEEDLHRFPNIPSVPHKIRTKIKVKGKFLLKRINDIQEQYGIAFAYCGNKASAANFVHTVFQKVLDAESR